MKRVTFVEKTIGEVGDGTAWPMEVTMDQLAEILYRVKDAWFTSGSVSTTVNDGEVPPTISAGIGMSMEGGTPPTEYISGDGFGSKFFIRGFAWWGPPNFAGDPTTGDPLVDGEDINADDQPYFGDSYNGGIPNESGVIFDYLADFFPATIDPSGYICRDVADNERAIWLPETDEPTSRFNGLTLRTAFSQEMACQGAGAGYLIDHPAPSQLRLEIHPEVAWVDDNESGNPYDPANKLYLKLRFGVACTATQENVSLDTLPDSGFHSYVEATDLVFELADSTCTAKIYCYSGLDNAVFDSASPFIIAAHEWWPYAKSSPPLPVWDSATGAKA